MVMNLTACFQEEADMTIKSLEQRLREAELLIQSIEEREQAVCSELEISISASKLRLY